MHQTKKNKQWYFGMKVHVEASKRGPVHSVATDPANEADITRLDDLPHGEETNLYGDQAYWSEDYRQQCKHAGIRYRVKRRAKSARRLTQHEKSINRSRSRSRAFGEKDRRFLRIRAANCARLRRVSGRVESTLAAAGSWICYWARKVKRPLTDICE